MILKGIERLEGLEVALVAALIELFGPSFCSIDTYIFALSLHDCSISSNKDLDGNALVCEVLFDRTQGHRKLVLRSSAPSLIGV